MPERFSYKITDLTNAVVDLKENLVEFYLTKMGLVEGVDFNTVAFGDLTKIELLNPGGKLHPGLLRSTFSNNRVSFASSYSDDESLDAVTVADLNTALQGIANSVVKGSTKKVAVLVGDELPTQAELDLIVATYQAHLGGMTSFAAANLQILIIK